MDEVYKPPNLEVGIFNQLNDSITIEGTVFSGSFFRDGLGINAMIGQILRIDKHENGVVTVTRMDDFDPMRKRPQTKGAIC